MLNLNEVETGSEQRPLELMPDKTPVRAIINLLGGDSEMPEFGPGFLFKKSCRLAQCIARWNLPSLVVSSISAKYGITFLCTVTS